MLRMAARPPSATARPHLVHDFRPTSGTLLGVLGLVVAGLVVVLVLVGERTAVGLRAALAAALVAVLVWMVLLRPRVKLYDDALVLRNPASDVHIPLAKVDDVTIRHTLVVLVDDDRYSCPGIGRSTRSMIRSSGTGPGGLSGPAASKGNEHYVRFVETTIEELARSARRDARAEPPAVTRRWAVPELTAAGILLVIIAVSFAF